MGKKINRIISAIHKIPASIKIPDPEQQNFNPPHISNQINRYGSNITVKKVWDGGHEDAQINENKIESIKPLINDENILNDVSENDSEEVWGS
ncbi:MAG: hypothetical protein EB003_13200, partial [Flavobacteriia bacterium]|nr:hypothetical protein [Flavobacteriia bacterium]